MDLDLENRWLSQIQFGGGVDLEGGKARSEMTAADKEKAALSTG